MFVVVSERKKKTVSQNNVASNLRKHWLLNILGTYSRLSTTCPSIFNSTIPAAKAKNSMRNTGKDTESSPPSWVSLFLCAFKSCSSFQTQPSGLKRVYFLTLTRTLWYFILIPCLISAPLIQYCVGVHVWSLECISVKKKKSSVANVYWRHG